MRAFWKKLHHRKGFTLVEMLIVVAITAILIAVSIPLVSSALERARCATDAANERAAKAAMTIFCLSTGTPGTSTTAQYFYDGETGAVISRPALSSEMSSYTPIGKCSKHDHVDKYLCIEFNWQTYEMKLGWGNFSGTSSGIDWGSNCSVEGLSTP